MRCSHDGYRRLPGRPQHTRQWSFGQHGLEVEDSISGTFGGAEARFHLHPSVRSEQVGSVTVLHLPRGQRVRINVEGGALRHRNKHLAPGVRTYGDHSVCCGALRRAGNSDASRLGWRMTIAGLMSGAP